MIWYYDLETYSTFFSGVFINYDWDKVDEYIEADINKDTPTKNRLVDEAIANNNIKIFYADDFLLLNDFIRTEVQMLIGYNNKMFDDPIINFICNNVPLLSDEGMDICNRIFVIAQYIIELSNVNKSAYDINKSICIDNKNNVFIIHNIKSIDLMQLNYLYRKKISLKQVGICTKWYRIQDLPYPVTYNLVLDDEIDKVIDYNINDVLLTRHLFLVTKEEFDIRVFASNEYDVNVLSESRSKTADIIMRKLYIDMTGMNYYEFKNLKKTFRRSIKFSNIISPKIYFTEPILIEFLKKLFTTTVKIGSDLPEDKLKLSVLYSGTNYTFALGGLHSKDKPKTYTESDKYCIVDCDVDSFYPMVLLNEKIHPVHISQVIYSMIVDLLTTERLKAKRIGDTMKAEVFKIIINSGLFGKLGSEYSDWYDLKAMYQTTINGQLYLLMLAERITQAGFQVVSANTDGIVAIVDKDKYTLYKEVCQRWSKETGFNLSYTKYTKYVRLAVNSYIAVTDKGKIKVKGKEFITDIQIDKGYFAPVISKAVQAFFINNTPVDEFLYNHDDIYDFCISQRTGKQFINQLHYIDGSERVVKELSKTIRYFVSNSGGTIMKKYKDGNKMINILKGHNVTVFNDYYKKDMKDYDIKYNFYKRKCYETIDRCLGNFTKDIKTGSGRLFDNI